MRRRILFAGAVGLVAFWYVYGSWLVWSGYSTDADQLIWGAQALLHGADPYAAARTFNTEHGVAFGLLYPMPAIVAGSFVAWMPLEIGRAVMAAVTAGLFAFFLTRDGWQRWPVVLSAAMRSSVSLVQLTPLLACAAVTPWFGWVLACKPNAGLAVWGAMRTRYALAVSAGVAVALVAVSFIVAPHWLTGWWAAVTGPHFLRPMVTRPFGFLLLLAALRWRRPEARWLLVTALIPTTANIYEALPLFVLGTWTFRETLVLAILSHLADLAGYVIRVDESYAALVNAHSITVLALFYLPALVLILRRPNVAPTR